MTQTELPWAVAPLRRLFRIAMYEPAEEAPILPTVDLVRAQIVGTLAAMTATAATNWRTRLSPHTVRAYQIDVAVFAQWMTARMLFPAFEVPSDAVAVVAAVGRREGDLLLAQWRDEQIATGLSPGRVGRVLSAIRSLLRLANVAGLCEWMPCVRAPASETPTDTKGPDDSVVLLLASHLASDGTPAGRRDLAIFLLLAVQGLRRNEVTSIRCEDWHGDQLWFVPKGRRRSEPVTVPESVQESLRNWRAVRPAPAIANGPMFTRLDRPGSTAGLSGTAIYKMVKTRAAELGIREGTPEFRQLRPNGLRHWSITTVAERGSFDLARRHAGHANANTTVFYIDTPRRHRADAGARITAGVIESQLAPEARAQAEAARLMGSLFRRKRKKAGVHPPADGQPTTPVERNAQEGT